MTCLKASMHSKSKKKEKFKETKDTVQFLYVIHWWITLVVDTVQTDESYFLTNWVFPSPHIVYSLSLSLLLYKMILVYVEKLQRYIVGHRF